MMNDGRVSDLFIFFQVVAIKERVNTSPNARPLKITTKYLCNSVLSSDTRLQTDLDSQYGFISARPFSDRGHAILFEGNLSHCEPKREAHGSAV